MNEAAPTARSRYESWLATSRPNIRLGLMLLALHAAVAWGIDDAVSRAMLLIHFGLFLLWQPVWRGERSLAASHTAIILGGGSLLVLAGSWWLITLWVAVLVGLLGGSVLGAQRRKSQRTVYLVAVLYLLALLLIWVVPQLFAGRHSHEAVMWLAQYGLLPLPVVVMLIRVERAAIETAHVVDFFSSLMLFLLVVALVLGSFVIKVLSKGDYTLALAQTLIAIAFVLLVLGWLWSPRSGFSGLGLLLSRYLLSVGLPFEAWLQRLTNLAEQESQPDELVREALVEIARLPWVAGATWSTPTGSGEFGTRSQHSASLSSRGFHMELFARVALTPALLLHVKLLAQLLGYFYEAKVREQTQLQTAYAQAIYETGARLTHDVKNLLQSLTLLCTAAQQSGPGQQEALNSLVQRQLPQITKRLRNTLDKLKAPRGEDATAQPAVEWWDSLRQRFAASGAEFVLEGEIPEGLSVPAELFDGAAENLLQNALSKRRIEPEVAVRVRFASEAGPLLAVSDTGAPVEERVARRLLTAPVPSRTGLGIGLYHVARQAQQLGYSLRLASNRPGAVCFELVREGSAPA